MFKIERHLNLVVVLTFLFLAACSSTVTKQPVPTPLRPGMPQIAHQVIWRGSVEPDSKIAEAVGHLPRLAISQQHGLILYAGSRSVQALRIRDGKTVWRRPLDGASYTSDRFITSIAVRGDDYFVTDLDGHVTAWSIADGKSLWRAELNAEVLSGPGLGAKVVVYHTGDGRVICLERSSGKRLWVYREPPPSLTLRGNSAPVVVGEKVISGFADGHLIALDVATGAVQWDTRVSDPKGHTPLARMADIDANVIVNGDRVYASAYQGRTVAISLNSGRVLWSRELSTHVGMDFWGKRIFIRGPSSEVWALDSTTGEIIWRQKGLVGRNISSPVASFGGVYVTDQEGYVHELAQRDGALRARKQLAPDSTMTPWIRGIDQGLLVISDQGAIWLLDVEH